MGRAMTPTGIEDAARQRYNAVNDTFWSQDEILNLIYAASLELSVEGIQIEATPTDVSVASQRAYDYPDYALAIKRVEYDGVKLEPITFREDDAITLSQTGSLSQGTPIYYTLWNNKIYLRPIPDTSALTIQYYTYNEPQPVTAGSTLDIPSAFHMDIVNYILAHMYAKDKDQSASAYYLGMWQAAVLKIKKWKRKRVRTDSFSAVQDIDTLPVSIIGNI